MISLKSHVREDRKTILSVAMYVQFYQDYEPLIAMIRDFRNIVLDLDGCKLIQTKEDLESDFQVGVILHIESGRTFENAKEQLAEVYDLGVRGIIPVHFEDNKIGNSCDAPKRRFFLKRTDAGLSNYGANFVEECNKLGMWLDLSHCTDKTANSILEIADHAMVSHVGIRDLVHWQRNFPIKFFKKLAAKGGVFGLCPWQHLIGDKPDAYQSQIEFAVEYDLQKAICIGSDFGAPIGTHENYRSLFDLEKAMDDFPSIAEDMQWNNAFNFFQSAL